MIESVNVHNDPLSPLVLLQRTLRVFPDRKAVVYGDDAYTWAQFGEEVGRMAAALTRAGVQRGDRVAILSPNTPRHLAAHFAAPLIGAPLVSINTRLAGREIAHILTHSGAKVLLVDPELAVALDAYRNELRGLEQIVEIADPGAGFEVRSGQRCYEEFSAGVEPLEIRNTVADENASTLR